MSHELKYIKLAGFKSVKDAYLEIGDLNVLIGSNGSGKSNFISAFRFLQKVVEQGLRIQVREAGGAERLLHYGSRKTPEMYFEVGYPSIFYNIKLRSNTNDELFVKQEAVAVQTNTSNAPEWQVIGESKVEANLKDASWQGGGPSYAYEELKKWRFYHFHDTSDNARVKKTNTIHDNLYLREDAANLAAFLYLMQVKHPRHFRRIEKTIQLVVPMFREFLLRPDPFNEKSIRLEWLSKDSDYIFDAAALSDGSLRFMCLCTLLLQPERPELILLDEPELGLHPLAIQILAGLLRKASHFSQLIISTQSVELISGFEPKDIVVVEHEDGRTTFTRPDAERLKTWLEEYSLGELWEKNIIGGRP